MKTALIIVFLVISVILAVIVMMQKEKAVCPVQSAAAVLIPTGARTKVSPKNP